MKTLQVPNLFDSIMPHYPTFTFNYVNGKGMKINEHNPLDEYFTKETIASYLYQKTREIISSYESNIDDYYWIDPSVGNGAFFNLLPKNKRIGIDIKPSNSEIIESDYLKYKLPDNKKIIVIGNPPFGHRGVIALNFINHSAKAEYVCFILPMFFESNGKGSIKFRVRHFNLLHSEILPKNSFYISNSNKKEVDIKCVFQIWSKNHKIDNCEFNWYKNRNKEPFPDILKLYTVSLAKNRECGKEWIFNKKPDFYISSTFYENVKVVKSFGEVNYKSGIAIVFTTKNQKLKKILTNIFLTADWKKYATLSTNSCYHLGKSNIFKLISERLELLTR
jgi:hypothetical protein